MQQNQNIEVKVPENLKLRDYKTPSQHIYLVRYKNIGKK